tara:strand:- start:7768 stop:9426 length:1659 start_codon:yes stop_codon:yes gene_type:complete
MNPFMQSHRCTLSTLGPVHLGTGEDYLPTHYIIDDGYLHAFDDMTLLKGLGAQGLNNLLSIVERGDDSALLAVRREILKHKDKLIPLASHSVYVRRGIENTYQKRVVNIAQREDGQAARNINNALKIARTAANPYSHQPELTGSAIKGAIRTAWLDTQLKLLLKENPRATNDRDFNRNHSKVLLQNSNVTDDPFYSLKVSDGSYHHHEGLAPTETLFAVGVRRKPSEKFAAKPLNTMLECISPWRDRCFNFDIRFLDNRLRTETGKDSGIVPTSLAEMAKACNDYYLPKLYDELAQLGDEGRYLQQDWISSFKTLLSGQSPLLKALLEQKAMLLRIGKHSGALDKTLNNARSIKIKGKGGASDSYRNTTTQVRLAGSRENEQSNLLPFGWVVIEFDDTNIPELRQIMHQQSANARQRLVKEQQRLQDKKEAARKLAEAEAEKQRQAAAAEAQRKAEDAAEQARQAELANMSEEQRLLAQLRHTLANSQQLQGRGPGNPLYEELRVLVAAATDWNNTNKAQARELTTDIFTLLGINRKKAKAAKKLWDMLKDA